MITALTSASLDVWTAWHDLVMSHAVTYGHVTVHVVMPTGM
jgi:hypothetical protein